MTWESNGHEAAVNDDTGAGTGSEGDKRSPAKGQGILLRLRNPKSDSVTTETPGVLQISPLGCRIRDTIHRPMDLIC